MKSVDVNKRDILEFLNGTQQFTLPIYQRRYSWKKEQCEQLWDDILRVGGNEGIPSHFLGSIVFMEEVSATIRKLRVIDGQQRLTTLSLLLSALGRALEAKSADIPTDKERLNEYYLFNEREEGELRYKQLLTQHDRNTLIQLLDEREPPDENSLLVQNSRFFEDKLKRADIEVVYRGIQKLMIVCIALDPYTDNPQLIFESLNATGIKLSPADLIRNYVLMGQEPTFQDKLYEIYWRPMEEDFEDGARFNLFIKDYLTLKTALIPKKGKVYESFKRYVDDKRQPAALEVVIKEIVCYSKHYAHIVLLKETDRELLACFEDIRTLDVEVAYPFLLGVYEDYTQKQLEKKEFINILRLVESYFFRRAICNLPRHSVNKIFAPLMRRINKGSYLQSLEFAFTEMTVSQRFPADAEFHEKLLTRDIYSTQKDRSLLRDYLLCRLENYQRKEPIHVKDYSIEHIMPQKLTDTWEEDIGENYREVHDTYLHTIGNLTLTGYNSELSNKTFMKKQHAEGGFLDSPLRLNQSLRQVERWDDKAIVNRAEMLVARACEIWPHHGISHERQQEAEWTLADHPYFTNEWSKLFLPLQQRILELGGSVSEKINKYYIAYKKNGASFVNVQGCKTWFRLVLRAQRSEIDDPRKMCLGRTSKTSWGLWLGIAAVDDSSQDYSKHHYQLGAVDDLNYISVEDDMDYIIHLVRQVFEQV